MVRRRIAIEVSPATRTAVKRQEGNRKKKREPLSESGSIFQQPIQRYFSLAGGQSYRRLVPFIHGAQSPYLAQTFTTDFLSVVYLKTV